jgi:antitoxin (DNA-binding transcriptional repressor) of toxin-antitoxin stability system
MIQATISQVKNRLSAYLRLVKAGETVLIMDRKTPVATLTPVTGANALEPKLERLIAAGVVARGEPPMSGESRKIIPTRLAEGVDVIATLLEERRSGR